MKRTAKKKGFKLEKEYDFSKAKRIGVEVFEDIKTGNLLFISETGAIAVLVP